MHALPGPSGAGIILVHQKEIKNKHLDLVVRWLSWFWVENGGEMMKAKIWSTGILFLFLAGMLSLGPIACKGSRSQLFKQCNEKQGQMLDHCNPFCASDRMEGESLDQCLDRCAKEKYGEIVPTCTGLSSSK